MTAAATRTSFELSATQEEKLAAWREDHRCMVRTVGAAGGKLAYEFIPTGVGTITKCACVCGKSVDLTEW